MDKDDENYSVMLDRQKKYVQKVAAEFLEEYAIPIRQRDIEEIEEAFEQGFAQGFLIASSKRGLSK